VAAAAVPIRARIGLIIPSGNRLTEPQFTDHAPSGVQIHVTRLRITGAYHRPLPEQLPRIVEAAQMLADAKCDVIVFHCTGSAMADGRAAEQRVVEAIQQATGRAATTTASALLEAFEALGVRRLVLVSPYDQATNDHETAFLVEAGIEVLHDRAMNLSSSEGYDTAPPDYWCQVTREAADPRADAFFLSCTNIQSMAVIEELERELGRPVVTSNQATLWSCLQTLELPDDLPGLGQLARLQRRTRASV